MKEYNKTTPLISTIFKESIQGKKFCDWEQACRNYFIEIGVDVLFLPMETAEDKDYPGISKKAFKTYSVAILNSKENYYKNRCYAIALFVIYTENKTPGFVRKYQANKKIIDEKPYYTEIIRIQNVLLDLKMAS